jgi:hypothetical protein
MLYGAILQISVLLDYKLISIHSFVASSATFIISITFFLSDVIAEVYGYQKAKQVVFSGVVGLVLFSSIGFFLQKLSTPPEYHRYAHAYDIILNLLFRAGISNAVAIMIGSVINVYYVSRWKVILRGRYFWLRSLGSSIVGEAIYTIFVVSLLNIGLVSPKQFIQILFISYSYKLIFDLFAIFPTCLLAQWLKKKENIEEYPLSKVMLPFTAEGLFDGYVQ